MKRFKIFIVFLASTLFVLPVQLVLLTPHTQALTNLVNNYSLETSSNNLPAYWTKDKYGNNKAIFSYNNFGHTGNKSASVQVSSYRNGSVKWTPSNITINPNTTYVFSDWSQSTVKSYVEIAFKSVSGRTTYVSLGSIAANSAWNYNSYTFKSPGDAQKITLYHYLKSNGKLTIDDYELSVAGTAAPAAPAPPITSVTAVGTNIIATITPVSCAAGTAQYEMRSRVNDGTWNPYSNWSTNLTATQAAADGVKYGYRAQARCFINDSLYSNNAVGNESTYIKSIATPAAPAATYATVDNNTTWSWSNTACPTGTSPSYQYKYTTNNGSDSGWTTTTQQSVIENTSTENVTYTISVIANCYNSYIASPWSSAGQASYSRSSNSSESNLITNSSLEQSANGTPTDWSQYIYSKNAGVNTFEPTGHTGSHSVKTTITSYSGGDAYWMFDPVPVTPGKTYSFSGYYKSDADVEVDIMYNLSNGKTDYDYLTIATKSPDSWSKASGEFVAPANAVSATVYFALAQAGYIQTDDYNLSEFSPQKFNRAIVSINFDDGWRSVYQNALPILSKYGLSSTAYIITGAIDNPEYMTTAMLQTLKNQGNEIASHSVTHPELTKLNSTNLGLELSSSQSALRQLFGISGVADNFASPYGEYDSNVINEIKKYYKSHRSIDGGYNSKDNFNAFNIKGQCVLSTTTSSELQSWINEAIATNTWLVLVYHEVGTTYDSPMYSVSTSNFDTQMSLIKQSGITIETNDQALNEILLQL